MGSSKISTGGSVRRRWFRLELLLVIILLYHVVFQVLLSLSSFGTESYLDSMSPIERTSNSSIRNPKLLSEDLSWREKKLTEISEQKELLSSLTLKEEDFLAEIIEKEKAIQDKQEIVHESEKSNLMEQDHLEARRMIVGAPEVLKQAIQPAVKQLDESIPEKEEPEKVEKVEVSQTSKLVWSIASKKATVDLEETPINLSSPACLPFLYNKRKDDNLQNLDYYDEFWSGNTAKRPTKIKFLHMRKAGGTTLNRYFKKVVKSNKTSFREFESCEGSRDCLDLDDNEDGYRKFQKGVNGTTGWDDSGSTLYVTHLREPVARAISNYKYSKRFKCRDAFADDFVPPGPDDERMTLEDFVNGVDLDGKGKFNPTRYWLWNCNSNCYARWVTGLYNPMALSSTTWIHPKESGILAEFMNSYPTISKYYYDDRDEPTGFGWLLSLDALTLLLRYDLIIVLEWLENDPGYARLVEDVFFGGVRGIQTKQHAKCSRSMKKMNALVPLEIQNATLERLHEVNDIDTKLYRIMTSCER